MDLLKIERRRVVKTRLVVKMVALYCRSQHGSVGFCHQCVGLQDYATERLRLCPVMGLETSCASCTVHCYQEPQRSMIREVMRFAGPKILFYAPILSLRYVAARFSSDRSSR